MNLVKEHINFKRGQSSKKSLGIGSRIIIQTFFKTYAPGVKYEIDDNLNIFVGGFLDLANTGISSLPDNLSVGVFLDLKNTDISSLPDNLSVGGSLFLTNTNISSLPDNLSVGGNIYKDF